MNVWGDAVKTMGNTGEKEVEFALYKNGDYLLLPVMLLMGKLDVVIIHPALISSAFDKEENETFLIIKDSAQKKYVPWCYIT